MSVKLFSIYCFLDQLNAHFAENNLTKKQCKNISWRGLALFFLVLKYQIVFDSKLNGFYHYKVKNVIESDYSELFVIFIYNSDYLICQICSYFNYSTTKTNNATIFGDNLHDNKSGI